MAVIFSTEDRSMEEVSMKCRHGVNEEQRGDIVNCSYIVRTSECSIQGGHRAERGIFSHSLVCVISYKHTLLGQENIYVHVHMYVRMYCIVNLYVCHLNAKYITWLRILRMYVCTNVCT